jgi:hypothetical protein
MAAGDVEADLSAFQLKVARLFFALPASQGSRARRLVRSGAASVLCDVAIRTDSVGRIS